MTFVLAALVAVAIELPHLLSLKRVSPPIAIALWLSALALRAVSGIAVVVVIARYLPASGAFGVLSHWCWHTVVPFVAAHLGFSGHSLGHAAAILPALVVAASAVSAVWAVVHAARAVRRLLRTHGLGAGPMDSVIVGGAGVRVAAAGLARPRVIVSAGALALLDDAELAASLEHERGHIARRHRYMLLCGEICCALGRLVPGSRAAAAELAFHVERDADVYAIARAHDRLALASAICKSATTDAPGVALTPLGDRRSVAGRVRLLLDGPLDRRRATERSVTLVAAATACLVLALAVAVPAWTAAGVSATASAAAISTCPS